MHASDPAPLSPADSDLGIRSAGTRARARSIVEFVGGTPLLELSRLHPGGPDASGLWAKAEFLNPTGSVKDRAARAIVEDALCRGLLGPGRRLLDASSGNTGVAYAFLGARLGFGVTICMPRIASAAHAERIRAYGAEVIFTDPSEGTDGAQQVARALADSKPALYYYADQYDNPANWFAHYRTTGPEIWAQTAGGVTHFVCGIGTGGTISGVGRFLKEREPSIRIIGVQPDGPIHGIEGLKHLTTARRPGVFDGRIVDATVDVSTEEAQAMARRLAQEEGLLVGTSAGASVSVALRWLQREPTSCVVTLLPDRGERVTRPREDQE